VFFGLGIALYFAATVEPPLWLGPAATALAVAVAVIARRHPVLLAAALVLAALSGGFALMQARSRACAAPTLARRLGPVAITGRVVDIDALERGWRVVIAPDSLPGLLAARQPALIRVHIGPTSDRLVPGDRVALRGLLYPVPGPIVPGGYDFQRTLYFARIGGVGYSFGGARRIGTASGGGWRGWLLHLRWVMAQRITAVLPGATGGIAAALVTGKRGAVPQSVQQDFRNSGLAHLLAIAGLHLGLVAGFVFFVVRGGLALVPRVALRYPIKKIAAGVTLVVLALYLAISGAAITTERAFIMNGTVFAAILFDRLRLSMRICAIAAIVVLVVDPASLVGPSFEMSFGAVVALIAVYETWGKGLGRVLHSGPWWRRTLGYAGGVAVTTFVATLGTDPIAIYHFHRLALYSPLANVVAVPLSAVWTLPWGVLSCLLMPFGLERLALVPMGWGIDATIWIARHVSAIPGDVWATPRLPTLGLVLVVAGGLWLCLWQGGWRRWGAVAILAGTASLALTRPPDIVIADMGRLIAARGADGTYLAAPGGNDRFDRDLLAEETGEPVATWPAGGAEAAGLVCTGARCVYAARGRRVAIVTGRAGVPLDCGGVDAIVSAVAAGFGCRTRMPVVDRIDSWRLGAVGLWLGPGGVALESANAIRGARPWVPRPAARALRY
jgi:competence protein ComEC